MGESKRRKQTLGTEYGKEQPIANWLPVTKSQAKQFYEITTRGAWIGITGLVLFWLTIRFVGPAFGWWTIN